MIRCLLFLVTISMTLAVYGQDSLVRPADSLRSAAGSTAADTILRDSLPPADSVLFSRKDPIALVRQLPPPPAGLTMKGHPFFTFTNPGKFAVTARRWEGKEPIFYSLIGLLLLQIYIEPGIGRPAITGLLKCRRLLSVALPSPG